MEFVYDKNDKYDGMAILIYISLYLKMGGGS